MARPRGVEFGVYQGMSRPSNRERDEARRQRRLEEDATKRAEQRKHYRRALAAACAAVLTAGVAVTSRLIPDSPAPVPISAEISHTGTMSITFAKATAQTTSPVCGCLRHDPPGGWQGIVMPARTLTMARSPTGHPTEFDLFSPGPMQWIAEPTSRGLAVRVSFAFLPSHRVPNTDAILTAARRTKFSFSHTFDILAVVTRGALSAASLGSEPVAALGVPSARPSDVSFAATTRSHDATLRVVAPLVPAQDRPGDETNNLPMLDIMGPHVLLWAPTDPKLAFVVADWREPPAPYRSYGVNTTGERNYTVSFTGAPPRRAVPRGFTAYTVVEITRGVFNVRIVPRPGADDAFTAVDPIPQDPGIVSVTVPQAASDAAKLIPVFRQADAHPHQVLNDIPFIADDTMVSTRALSMPLNQLYASAGQEFELPPTPPVSGVNVFGQIARLSFTDARGEFTLGKEPLSLKAATPLEMRNFNSVGRRKNHLLIPIQVDSNRANFKVQGDADTRINGEAVATHEPLLKQLFAPDVVALVSSIVSAFFVLLGGLEIRRAKR